MLSHIQPGDILQGFVLEKRKYIEEIDSTVLHFSHQLLRTPVLAIKNSDPNKTFCLGFRTIPTDSTGVAHILEHSVLMGSRRYPVRDVFGEINKGGLTTFLNAMTGADTTWYPFATRNMKEYFNLMDVYGDVTFHPLLERTTFEQEGWHYHLTEPDGVPQIQGVVYNEMKGAFSDPFRHLFHHTMAALMPGSTYIHESGGDPARIPDLTYEDFKAFHRRHYHPSNCMLFFYGDADLERELTFIQDRFLAEFNKAGDQAAITLGSTPNGLALVEETYGIFEGADQAGKTFLALASLTGHSLQHHQNIALKVIANILYNSDASPLKNAVIQAGICQDFGGLFVQGSSYRTFMMTYLIGSEGTHLDRFREIYRDSLSAMIDKGLDRDLVLAELNKYEFAVREEVNKPQRGLEMIGKALTALKYGGDPFAALEVGTMFAEVRKRATAGGYFEGLIRELLLDNQDSVAVILRPDPQKLRDNLRREQERIESFFADCDQVCRDRILERTRQLIRLQSTANDDKTLALLPALSLEDLEPDIAFHWPDPHELHGFPLLLNQLPTNDITYVDIGFACSGLEYEHLLYLDLFGTIVTEIGTESMDYREFARQVNRVTGGFSHSFSTYQQISADHVRPVLWLHVKMLNGYLDQAMDLVRTVLQSVSFADRQRIREIVQREFAWADHSVQSEGYSLAMIRVFAHLGPSGAYNEAVSGASAFLALKELATNFEEREQRFLELLEEIRDRLLNGAELVFSVTGDHPDRDDLHDHLESLATDLPDPGTDIKPVAITFPEHPRRVAFTTSAEVVYNVQGCQVFPSPTDQYQGSFEVLRTWLSRDYLWNSVRQRGGAYGCFIQFSQVTGNLALISYRDPQVEHTFAAYQQIPAQVADLSLSDPVLRQLIIGTYGSFDPHQGPAGKGATARNEYLSGIDPEFKRQRVREILSASDQDLRRYASFLDCLRSTRILASIGNTDLIRHHSHLYDQIIEL